MKKKQVSAEKLEEKKVAFEKAMENMTPDQTLLVKTFMAGVEAASRMVDHKKEGAQ